MWGGRRIYLKISAPLHASFPFMSENIVERPSELPWYAVRTFNCLEQKVSRFLEEKAIRHFIPMTFAGEERKILVPAIHNLLFIQKPDTETGIIKTLSECPFPVSIFRYPGDRGLCEISERDMIELRMLCDPQYKTTVFMTQGEAEATLGKDVRVINGPFKGSVGRLVRKNKQYYFLKIVIGIGVMVRVSRWYCEPI